MVTRQSLAKHLIVSVESRKCKIQVNGNLVYVLFVTINHYCHSVVLG